VVIELQEKILAAQASHLTLLQQVGALEKEVTELTTWMLRSSAMSLRPSDRLAAPNHRIGFAQIVMHNRKRDSSSQLGSKRDDRGSINVKIAKANSPGIMHLNGSTRNVVPTTRFTHTIPLPYLLKSSGRLNALSPGSL
jgi:hypothetical protein